MFGNSTKHLLTFTPAILLAVNCFAQQKPDVEKYPYSAYKNLANKAAWLHNDL